MNLTTIIGCAVMLILVLMAMMGTTGPSALGAFFDIPSVQIVVLGTLAGGFASFPLQKTLKLPSVFGQVIAGEKGDPLGTIKVLVDFAEKARKEGILALEAGANKVSDEFLKRGLNLAVDGTEAGLIRDIMKTELSGIETRHDDYVKLFEYMSGLAPAMGMLGTFVGLILMLGNLSDIASLGPNMAVAIITSFYGALMANCIFNPIANTLAEKTKKELLIKNIMIEGIMSIVAGDNPRIVEQKLAACLDPVNRTKVLKQR